MGRPERRDVDYFPFFIKDGRTLFILEGKYQCKGTGFFTNLFRFLSRTPDHHFQLKTESDILFFFTTVKCDQESALDMINLMVTTGKLDKDLWDQERVLASQDFLDSIQDAYRKRTNSCITLDEIKQIYNITTGSYPHATEFPAEVIDDISDGGGITTGGKPQSKVKESKDIIPYGEIVSYLNEKTGKHFKPTSKATRGFIHARWEEDKDYQTIDAFKYVIDVKCKEWLGNPKYENYLRPQTLFGNKFDGYLNERA